MLLTRKVQLISFPIGGKLSRRLPHSGQLPALPIRRNASAARQSYNRLAMNGHGDLNNEHAARANAAQVVEPAYRYKSLAIAEDEDDAAVRQDYRPFLLPPSLAEDDWVAQLELSAVLRLVESELLNRGQDRLRILILYGSLRSR